MTAHPSRLDLRQGFFPLPDIVTIEDLEPRSEPGGIGLGCQRRQADRRTKAKDCAEKYLPFANTCPAGLQRVNPQLPQGP